MSVEVDPALASLCGAVVAGISAAGAVVARAIRWAARVHREAQREVGDIVRENTAAFNRVSELLGRVDARTADIVREQTGPVPRQAPASEAETPKLRRFPRAESKPKG